MVMAPATFTMSGIQIYSHFFMFLFQFSFEHLRNVLRSDADLNGYLSLNDIIISVCCLKFKTSEERECGGGQDIVLEWLWLSDGIEDSKKELSRAGY